MPTCSVSLRSFGDRIRPALDWAGRQHARMIELDGRRQVRATDLGATARRQLRHLLSERSLSISGLEFPVRGSIADTDRLADRIEFAMQTMQLAHDLGTNALVVPFRVPAAEDHERTIDVLRNLAVHGDHVGCLLTIRSGDGSDQMLSLLREASAAAPIAIQFDPVSCILGEQQIEAAFSGLADFIRQIRVCDAIRSSGSIGRETAIGRGEVPFELLAAMAQQVPIQAAVVSPEDTTIAPLNDGLAYARAVFEVFD